MGLSRPAKVAFFSFFLLVLILLALSISLVAVIDIRGITETQESATKTVGRGMYAIECPLLLSLIQLYVILSSYELC